MSASSNSVDLNALKFNQLSIIALTLLGYILDVRLLPGFVAALMVLGGLFPQAALFKNTLPASGRSVKHFEAGNFRRIVRAA